MIPNNISSVLINGDKLELENILFQCAIHYAELGFHIWFISPQPFNQLPENLKPPDKEILKLITFLYLKDQRDLLTHLNGIQLWRQLPELIILNGYDYYCSATSPDYDLVNAAFTTASILDATSACALKHPHKKAYLLVSCHAVPCGKNKQLNTVTDMYFNNVLTCGGNNSDIVVEIKACLNW